LIDLENLFVPGGVFGRRTGGRKQVKKVSKRALIMKDHGIRLMRFEKAA
jgi:hypothetical protein